MKQNAAQKSDERDLSEEEYENLGCENTRVNCLTACSMIRAKNVYKHIGGIDLDFNLFQHAMD